MVRYYFYFFLQEQDTEAMILLWGWDGKWQTQNTLQAWGQNSSGDQDMGLVIGQQGMS